jgi:hypothetical protein
MPLKLMPPWSLLIRLMPLNDKGLMCHSTYITKAYGLQPMSFICNMLLGPMPPRPLAQVYASLG